MDLPSNLVEGERARLFPVVSDGSGEKRATSIFLACLTNIDPFARALLKNVGGGVSKRSKINTYTEVRFSNEPEDLHNRPDGLIEVTTRGNSWGALVEAKIGNSKLNSDQVERYLKLARANDLKAVITISNEFSTNELDHPAGVNRNMIGSLDLRHWSWMHVLTEADMLIAKNEVDDPEQRFLLNELRRFLSHKSAGVKGFDRMPSSWPKIIEAVGNGAPIRKNSAELHDVISAWHQQVRHLSLMLSGTIGDPVLIKLSRDHARNPKHRLRDEMKTFLDESTLKASLDVPEHSSPLVIEANASTRRVRVSIRVKAPTDMQRTETRVNWLLRQIGGVASNDVFVRLIVPRQRNNEQFSLSDLRASSSIVRDSGVPTELEIAQVQQFENKFGQVTGFVTELERLVPNFHSNVVRALHIK